MWRELDGELQISGRLRWIRRNGRARHEDADIILVNADPLVYIFIAIGGPTPRVVEGTGCGETGGSVVLRRDSL